MERRRRKYHIKETKSWKSDRNLKQSRVAATEKEKKPDQKHKMHQTKIICLMQDISNENDVDLFVQVPISPQ